MIWATGGFITSVISSHIPRPKASGNEQASSTVEHRRNSVATAARKKAAASQTPTQHFYLVRSRPR